MRRMPTRKTQHGLERLEQRVLFAAFPVTTTADSGAGSLRQAILDANANTGNDTITFAISTGAQTISPATPLPALTDAAGATIAGSTQPGFVVGTPVITIDGGSAGTGADGLTLSGGNNTVIGLIIQDFDDSQIAIDGPGSDIVLGCVIQDAATGVGILVDAPNVRIGGPGTGDRNVISGNASAGIQVVDNDTIIENNRIGTNAAGTAGDGNGSSGITIGVNAEDTVVVSNLLSGNTGSGLSAFTTSGILVQGNTIGLNAAGNAALVNTAGGVTIDASPDASIIDNVISGNGGDGILIGPGSADVLISGNEIGTNPAGTSALPNNGAGIFMGGALRPVIVNNVISGNTGNGIGIADNVSNGIIQDNFIGTGANGTTDLGNGGHGVVLANTGPALADDTLVGGTSGQGNTIAFNGGAGIKQLGGGDHNSFLGNSIFSNDGLGIDLGTAGRTANDADDTDSGENGLQNFPVLSSVVSTAGTTTVGGVLDSNASEAFRIEFFSDPAANSADVEGKTFLGFVNVTTDANGVASFSVPLSATVATGVFVTAIATDSEGNSSEFSDAVASGTIGPDIQISGNGVVITDGDDTPTSGDFTSFGSATVGGAAVDRVYTITNTGQGTLDLSAGVTLSGPGASQFSVVDQPNSSLGAAATTNFRVRFTPTGGGTHVATVSVTSNDADESPYTFDISGDATTPAPAPEIEITGNGNPIASGDVTPSTNDHTDFGSTTAGGGTVTRTFTISNAGQQDLTVGSVSLTGANASQFSVTAQPGSGTLTPGQSTTFSVRFAPTAGGTFNATVSVANNDSNENPYTFAVRGQTAGSSDDQAPTATLLPQDQQPIPQLNSATLDFVVRYNDDQGLSVGSFDDADVLVTGPGGFSQTARFVSQQSSGTTQADVTYRIDAPGGTLDAADDGDYTVTMLASAVSDTGGNFVAAGVLGTLDVDLAGSRSSLGSFGLVNGRRQKLTITETDGTIVVLSLSGNGTGEAFRDGNRIDLEVTSSNGKLSIVTRGGGNGRAEINDIRIAGGLKNVTASTADINGVVISSGDLSAMTFGSTDGATISTPAPIKSLKVLGDMNDTQVFSGTLLGLDGRVGGSGIASDQFGAGEIRKFNVTGSVNDSLIAAGLDPVDGILLNGNDNIVGGANSRIRSVTVRGAVDNDTTFAAGAFPRRAKIGGQSIDPLVDSRFDSTP